MKLIFVLPILLSLLIPYQLPSSNGDSPLVVTKFKWTKARRAVETPPVEGNAPARAMIPQNRNFARNARINDPAGVRDPNVDTLDGRSAAIGCRTRTRPATRRTWWKEDWGRANCEDTYLFLLIKGSGLKGCPGARTLLVR